MAAPQWARMAWSQEATAGERHAIDAVSVADLLRNGFVYPPHSIFEGGRAMSGNAFLAAKDESGATSFRFRFPDSGKRSASAHEIDWVSAYHRQLCDAVLRATRDMHAPWSLQSGGKDSTTLAIAIADARPDTTCITYLGGREENEVGSARTVASALGLRHEVLVCDPGRAYDRYLAIAPRMPSLTADFALLSYVDIAFEVTGQGGDGMLDGLGSDLYFGIPVNREYRMLRWLARGLRLPRGATELPWIGGQFEVCFALGTLQMNDIERVFPGSRFTDAEVDALFGRNIAGQSRARLAPFLSEIRSAGSLEEQRAISLSIAASAGGFAKGAYTAAAMPLRVAFPFCDEDFCDWVYGEVPAELMMDPATGLNKVLVRQHIATRFDELPYVSRKGSFRFDVRGLAAQRFEQVHAYAQQSRHVLPGAVQWLERNRQRLDNKYHASKFYLLAVVLPWLCRQPGYERHEQHDRAARRATDADAV
jgi:asparagine synthetase B (glutamine-hydrolysing)